jgi:hypothetical protein
MLSIISAYGNASVLLGCQCISSANRALTGGITFTALHDFTRRRADKDNAQMVEDGG